MRPIPAPRIGDSHGLMRAIDSRSGRMRIDELVTDFGLEQLFPPELENALGRMRHFLSYARSAGFVKEDRGVVELTEIGRRYLRAAGADAFFDVAPAQAEWLRRQLREKHMTDSIYHGLAIGLSLLASLAPDEHVATLDFGRSLAYLGRAGWDNENTFRIQGERYVVLLTDMELIDADWRLTATGAQMRAELTLPDHVGLLDVAAQLSPGGADAVREAAAAEWTVRPESEVEPESVEEGRASAPPEPHVSGEWVDVAGAMTAGVAPTSAAAPERGSEGGEGAPGRDEGVAGDGGTGAPGDGVAPPRAPARPASAPPIVPVSREPFADDWGAADASDDGDEEPGDADERDASPGAVAADAATAEPPDESAAVAPADEPMTPAPEASAPAVPNAAAPAISAPGASAAAPDAAAPAAAPVTLAPDASAPAVPDAAASAAAPEVSAPDAPPAAVPDAAALGTPAPGASAAAVPDAAAPGTPVADVPAAAVPSAAASAISALGASAAAVPEAVAPSAPGMPAPDVPAAAVPDAAAPGDAPEAPAPETSAPAVRDAGAPAAVPQGPRAPVVPAGLGPAARRAAVPPRDAFLAAGVIRAAAEAAGLRLPAAVYANVAAALAARKHVLLTGAPGSGKTTLALAVARAAAQVGRSRGATLVTARPRWHDAERTLVDAAASGRWVIVDELERARLDRTLGALSSFLAGAPVLLADAHEERAPQADWRLVATWGGGQPRASAALLRRFAVVEVAAPPAPRLREAIVAAAHGDATAIAATERLLPLATIAPLGAGVFLDAARHARARLVAVAADDRNALARMSADTAARRADPVAAAAAASIAADPSAAAERAAAGLAAAADLAAGKRDAAAGHAAADLTAGERDAAAGLAAAGRGAAGLAAAGHAAAGLAPAARAAADLAAGARDAATGQGAAGPAAADLAAGEGGAGTGLAAAGRAAADLAASGRAAAADLAAAGGERAAGGESAAPGELELARELFRAYVAPLLGELDERDAARVRDLLNANAPAPTHSAPAP